MAKKQMYSRADELLTHLKKFIKNEFNRMGLLGFDELNVLNVQSQTEQLYTNLKEENMKVFADGAKNAQEYALKLIAVDEDSDTTTKEYEEKISESKKKKPKGAVVSSTIGTVVWLTQLLSEYNINTGYLYDSETDRKRMRYNEEILTAREYGDREAYNKATNTSANLWYGQSEQYLLTAIDTATLETYKNNGIEKVRWMTEMDSKVCKTCKERHGIIYPIEEVPEKPHRRCRCYLVPVKDEDK